MKIFQSGLLAGIFLALTGPVHAAKSMTGRVAVVFATSVPGVSSVTVTAVGMQPDEGLSCTTDANTLFGRTALSTATSFGAAEDGGAVVALTCNDDFQLITLALAGDGEGDEEDGDGEGEEEDGDGEGEEED